MLSTLCVSWSAFKGLHFFTWEYSKLQFCRRDFFLKLALPPTSQPPIWRE